MAVAKKTLPGRLKREIDDMVSEGIMQAWKTRAGYRGDASLGAYIAGCIRYSCLKHLGRKDPLLRVNKQLHESSLCQDSGEAGTVIWLWAENVMGSLHPKNRAALQCWAEGRRMDVPTQIRSFHVRQALKAKCGS
jgi:DNA-directed RNA polymerase specialized sigma24 family protein